MPGHDRPVKILIAEDDRGSALVLRRTVSDAGYAGTWARDGALALEALEKEPFAVLLTDWMMPNMDGIALIREVRRKIRPAPVIIVTTSITSPDARSYAIEAGADDYLSKPCRPADVLSCIESCLGRRSQPQPRLAPPPPAPPVAGPPPALRRPPPFIGVGIAASTGGPQALCDVIKGLPTLPRAAVLLLLHGPDWLFTTFARRLQEFTEMPVLMAEEGLRVAPGHVYMPRGGCHMSVAPGSLALCLRDGPPENFVRPAADPLFRSMARVFGRHAIAAVLTGLGRDGSLGAGAMAAAGGVVLAQDPATAVAPSMPESVVRLGIVKEVAPLQVLPGIIHRHVNQLATSLH